MGFQFFDPLVARYIADRIKVECRVRGMKSAIAKATGFSMVHIGLIAEGKRNVGEDLATAMAEYWGISRSRMQGAAHEYFRANGGTLPDNPTHPNLDATLLWCKDIYPDEFLQDYERNARRFADRPKPQWLSDVHTNFVNWMVTQPMPMHRKYMQVLNLPMPNYQRRGSHKEDQDVEPQTTISTTPEQSETRTISDENDALQMSSTPEHSQSIPMPEQASGSAKRRAK